MANLHDFVFAPYIRDADRAGRAPWHVAERRLLDYLLVFIEQGVCCFTLNGDVLPLQAGMFCLIQPGQRIELRGLTHTVTPYAHFDVFYNPRREESFATRPGQINLLPYQDLQQPGLNEIEGVFLAPCFEPPTSQFCEDWLEIVHLWNSPDALANMKASQRLGILLLRILSSSLNRRDGQSPPAIGRRDFGWVPSYLSTHLSEPISVADMARKARLSPSRFHAVFQQQFGTSPRRYLLEMRVQHAAELLANTDWTLAHISSLCGFADVHHFAHTFKRVTRRTPGEYRHQEKIG